MSTERVIIPTGLVGDFTRALKQAANEGSDRFRQGSLEALYSNASARRINSLVDDAVKQGAEVIIGGPMVGEALQSTLDQANYPITVLGNVTRDMAIWREETFGPLVILSSISSTTGDSSEAKTSLDEAVTLAANDSAYGLAASIYSKDIGRALEIAGRLETGMVRINAGTVGDDPTVVFG